MGYPSDVSDAEWKLLSPYFERTGKPGRPQKYEMRSIVNACLYVLHSGCQWRMLPHDFPQWDAVYWHFNQWGKSGLWQHVMHRLHALVRKLEGREAQPSAAIVDSQSVKTARKKGLRRRKIDMRKQAPHPRRHARISSAHPRA